jgi:hypothetical protein
MAKREKKSVYSKSSVSALVKAAVKSAVSKAPKARKRRRGKKNDALVVGKKGRYDDSSSMLCPKCYDKIAGGGRALVTHLITKHQLSPEKALTDTNKALFIHGTGVDDTNRVWVCPECLKGISKGARYLAVHLMAHGIDVNKAVKLAKAAKSVAISEFRGAKIDSSSGTDVELP